jgi:cytochrome c oxidase subunit 2
MGNQWYWSYQQGTSSEYQSTLYRRSLTSTSMMTNRWAMGYWAISSNDVIHNWRVARASDNTLRIKMDAYPGRINVSCHDGVRPNGIYLGYCSELCGAHHAYMPISLVCYYY